MLLGADNSSNKIRQNSEGELICQLINAACFADAYLLLQAEPPDWPATQYNLALCYYSAAHYHEALACVEKARMLLPVFQSKLNRDNDSFYKTMRGKQNQLDDYKQALNAKRIELLPVQVADAIVRLKTDCWLQLKDYARVIEAATPMAYKNYLNITEALNVARNNS
ncbi:hypothetical protein LT679_00955 [Mucilaginibacter roseus]|uniref:Tetratricopeptide repeat protein n=1 Tax=Mucilaginibacter roseus TaxID=1528868 RepID=A0ABS8TZR2_9SPHI|nr:hypothetical protein [Mucilaginibacter roseus]MCD8739154.1 hypothetical protein [Mucilaginibacter roseus]